MEFPWLLEKETVGVTMGFTVTDIGAELAVAGLAQVKEEVKATDTVCPLVKLLVANVFPVCPLTGFPLIRQT
jgi:hypothetical protein